MKGKILIADELHSCFRDRAINLGYEVDDFPAISRAEVLEIIGNYTGIAIRTKFKMDAELLHAGSNLKFIARAGAGLDNIDVALAKSKNIQLINAPEGNADAVGEHAIGLILSLMNNFRKALLQLKNGQWDREGNRGYELKGKTVGIIGYGFMGQSVARKLAGFDVKVLAFDKYKTGFSDLFAKEASMEEIVKEVDVLSLHLPLTAETKGMVNEEYLRYFKKPIFFINTARGEIVQTEAILKAVQAGSILGAGLDVLETEKFPALGEKPWFNDLLNAENVILSPHVAGWTFDSYRKISEVLGVKLAELG